MDTHSALARFEAALESQLLLGSADPSVEEAGRALLAAMEPAIKELTMELAAAAAADVQSQLPEFKVEVVFEAGEPRVSVRSPETADRFDPSDYEARVTVRLPDSLKGLIESAAEDTGDSINTWIVKALSAKTRRRPGRSVSGTFDI